MISNEHGTTGLRNGLFITAAILLAVGISLWVYGANLNPSVGEAVTNVFDGEFSDKRDIFMYSGIGLTVLGGVSLLAGVFYTFNRRTQLA
jgi:hypothetical protein